MFNGQKMRLVLGVITCNTTVATDAMKFVIEIQKTPPSGRGHGHGQNVFISQGYQTEVNAQAIDEERESGLLCESRPGRRPYQDNQQDMAC